MRQRRYKWLLCCLLKIKQHNCFWQVFFTKFASWYLINHTRARYYICYNKKYAHNKFKISEVKNNVYIFCYDLFPKKGGLTPHYVAVVIRSCNEFCWWYLYISCGSMRHAIIFCKYKDLLHENMKIFNAEEKIVFATLRL